MTGRDVLNYTPEAKSIAKSLVLALGSARAAERHLAALWGDNPEAPSKVPDRRTLDHWKLDPSIEVDEEFLERFRNEVRNATLGAAHRLGGQLEGLLESTIDQAKRGEMKTLDVLNAAKSWGIVADKMNGRFGNPVSDAVIAGIGTVNGNVIFVAYGPKPVKAAPDQRLGPVIDGESREIE